MMLIENVFALGQKIYIRTDPDQTAGFITEIRVKPGGLLLYMVTILTDSHLYYDFELSEEPDISLKYNNE